MSKAITITIGRNVGTAPMLQSDWDNFRQDVQQLLNRQALDIYIHGNQGQGTWTDKETGVQVFEDNAVWVAEVPESRIDDIRGAVSTLRKVYGQDAAGFIVGDGELV